MTGRREVAGLPEEGPATPALVKAHLGITDTRDDDAIAAAVDAVNSLVRGWPCSLAAADADDWADAPDVVQGSVMLAARHFRRKNSPGGVESVGTLGAVYVQRNDPDVAMLLGVGPYAGPEVG